MIHPDTSVIRISEELGHGVVASRRIPRGTMVWVQDRFDRVISRSEGRGLDEHHRAVLDRFAHRDERGDWILCWDAGRLVNHACDPTLRGIGPNAMVARRDLRPGDEITCDYAECNLDAALHCQCGGPQCRGTVYGHDLLRLGPGWDEEAAELVALALEVRQPLLPFAIDRLEIEGFLLGRAPLPPFAGQSPFAETPRQ